jgi:hypothetical protein
MRTLAAEEVSYENVAIFSRVSVYRLRGNLK